MLQAIRDKTQNWISIVIIGFLILMFGMWGISYYLSSSAANPQTLVKINGQSIPMQAYQSLYNLERQAASEEINQGKLSISDLKNLILSSLIQQEVLSQAALAAGLGISTPSIDAYIISMPSFQQNKQFSQTLYQDYLQRVGLTTQGLRDKIQRTGVVNQWQLGFNQSDFILPKEVQQYSDWLHQRREIQWWVVPSNSVPLSSLSVTPQEMQTYYNTHASLMMAPAQVKINYVLLSMDDLRKKLLSSQPHSQNLDQAVQEQYADLGNQLANLTFENPQSLDPAASQLGLTVYHSGWISAGGASVNPNLPKILNQPEILNQIFSKDLIQTGQNSDPININSNQAVIVVRVVGYEPAKEKSFSDPSVQEICKTAVLKQKQQAALKQLAASVLSQQSSLKPSMSVQMATATLTRAGNDQKNKNLPAEIKSAAFSLSLMGDLQNQSRVIFLPNGDAVAVKLLKILPAKNTTNLDPGALSFLRNIWVSLDQSQYLAYWMSKAKIVVNTSSMQGASV